MRAFLPLLALSLFCVSCGSDGQVRFGYFDPPGRTTEELDAESVEIHDRAIEAAKPKPARAKFVTNENSPGGVDATSAGPSGDGADGTDGVDSEEDEDAR